MRRFTPRGTFGSGLALFALAVQFVVTFGHVHLYGIHRVAPVIAAAAAQVRSLPAQPPATDDDGYCAICASIYLASNTFAPQAPQLPVPTGWVRIEHSFAAISSVVEPRRIAFQARAPPLS